ncbi:MAG TPA: hypothetical protein ENN34_03520 [Deltaproteobacteria bacterium]|nr:hypothetical protein [Deltaproteobacteria bacterium]
METPRRLVLCALAAVIIVLAPGVRASGEEVVFNGAVFTDDSTELHKNRYFSEYARTVDFAFIGYGYGDFRGYTLRQVFSQNYSYLGIECVIIRETGYIPTPESPEDDSPITLEHYTRFLYYAKDDQNNIHLINVSGDTTLLYPHNPVIGQRVFGGYVDAVGYTRGNLSDCLIIVRDSLPWGFPDRMTEYLIPGSGIAAVAYNYNGGMHGFSADGTPPELARRDKSTWEEWVNDRCFISASGGHRSWQDLDLPEKTRP